MRKAIVYCHDTEAGLLEESTPGRGYTFTYDKQYMMDRTHDPVSLTMPFREAPYQSDYLFPVFTNMLPEGANRKIQLSEINVPQMSPKMSPNNTF